MSIKNRHFRPKNPKSAIYLVRPLAFQSPPFSAPPLYDDDIDTVDTYLIKFLLPTFELNQATWPFDQKMATYIDVDCTTDDGEGFRVNCSVLFSIQNTTQPASHLLYDDDFKLKYDRDSKLLTLSNNRGFSYSKKHCADGCRFFFMVAGVGISIVKKSDTVEEPKQMTHPKKRIPIEKPAAKKRKRD